MAIELAVVEGVVGRADFGGGTPEPAGLDVHHLDQREVVLVVEDGRAGEGLEARGPGDVIDVRVGDEDLLDGEIVALEEGEDARNLVAGIDDDGLAGGLVAEDGAVALQRADGEDLVDHGDLDRGENLATIAARRWGTRWGTRGRLFLWGGLLGRCAGEDGFV